MKGSEIWKDIKGHEGAYQVSTHGRVRSVDRFVEYSAGGLRLFEGVVLKQKNSWDGYPLSFIKKNRRNKTVKTHRLVAETFIPNPENKPQVNHIDSDRTNNHVDNLEWVTAYENKMHSVKKGLGTKVDKEKVKKIRNLSSSGEYTQKEIASIFNIDQSNVSLIINRKIWDHVK